jgi:hypothetical protein
MSVSRTWCISLATMTVLTMAPMAASVAGTYLADVDSTASFLDHAQLRDWLADGERGLWLQAVNLRWFYARFAHACRGLGATNSLSFDTRGSDNIDSRSAVVVPGRARCMVLSFLPSQGPPKSRNASVVLQPQAQ